LTALFLNEQLAQASPNLIRDLLTTFVNALLSAQADAVCGACYGERTEEQANSRNGYRHRDLDTRVGTLDVAVPKLRTGSLCLEWRPAGSGRRNWLSERIGCRI
jgi:putative transposase